MKLPADCRLVYTVMHEAWSAGATPDEPPAINVSAAFPNGSVAWDFQIVEHLRGLRSEVFDDAWCACAQAPELFAALAGAGRLAHADGGRDVTLNDVTAILDRLGAADVTARVSPYASSSEGR